MEIGEPDFDTPEHIKKAAGEALDESHTHYTPSAGIPELRDAIAEYAAVSARSRRQYAVENVVVAPGAKPIIWNILSALLDPGRRYHLLRSGVSCVRVVRELSPGNVHAIPLLESRNWRMDLDELTPRSIRTKAVVINSPHNPTGGVLTRRRPQRIADMASATISWSSPTRSTAATSISIAEYVSIATLAGMRDRTIIVDGFSKAYAMTGWRLGYAIMPESWRKAVTLFNNNTFSCVDGVRADGGHRRADGSRRTRARMNEKFRKRRDRLVNGLNDIRGMSCTMPEGAFYAFPNVTAITQDDRALAKFLLEEGGVACGGGSSFGAAGKGYLRFSYAASLDDIDWALEQIARVLPDFKG